jgi:transcription initiation factor TFIIB
MEKKRVSSITSLMLTPVEEKVLQTGERKELQFANGIELCRNCNDNAIIFDVETNETVCSTCGMVLNENCESLAPEWKTYSIDDIQSKSRTGMPTSLALHDMGLSTFISYSNVDANGGAISPD